MYETVLSCSMSSMHHSYKDRFALLAESMERERHDIGVREKAQAKVVSALTQLECTPGV